MSQLLTFARREQLAQEPIDLNALVLDKVDLLRRTLGGAVVLDVRLEPGPAPTLANRAQLESVLLNLCINARDAMPHGGTLAIGTRRHTITEEPATRIDDLPKGAYVVMSVEDTGTGMDETTLSRCLEPFFSTKIPGRGTGLGLSQAVTAVQQSGGNLRIHSAPGAGTRVEMSLPLAHAGDDAAAGNAASPPRPPSLTRKTVLLVDGDPEVLESTSQLLQASAYEVIPAASAEDAMAFVLASRPFDVLVTDDALPRMSGAELVERARQLRPKLVAIVTTGAGDVDQLQRSLPQVAVLGKPLASRRLFEAIEAAVSTHRLRTGER